MSEKPPDEIQPPLAQQHHQHQQQQPYSPRTSVASQGQPQCDPEKIALERPDPPRSYTDGTLVDTTSPPADMDMDIERDAEAQLPRRATTGSSIMHKLGGIKQMARNLTGGLSQRERDDADLTPEHIDYHPNGYPRLAAWINSDENFLMCRRYGFLHARVMLYRQDELRELEQALLDLDAEDEERDRRFLMSREKDDRREGAERKKLINEIDAKLKEYDDAVMRARHMASLPKAEDRNYDSLANWMSNQAPLCGTEARFVEHQQDFVALLDPKEGGWFDAFIEDIILPLFPRRMTMLMFSDRSQRLSTRDKHTYLFSKPRIDRFARILVTCLAVALLMAPVVVLFQDGESGAVKIVVILVFTLGFSAALSVFTKAKRHEVFASTAAYCAVLVVFLGNFN